MKIEKIKDLENSEVPLECIITDGVYRISVTSHQMQQVSAKFNIRVMSFKQDYRDILLVNSGIPLIECCLEKFGIDNSDIRPNI